VFFAVHVPDGKNGAETVNKSATNQ